MTYSSEVLADSPAVYYKLDEATSGSLVDSSGNARHGALPAAGFGPQLLQPSLLGDGSGNSALFDLKYAYVDYAAWMNAAQFTVEARFQAFTLTANNPIATVWTDVTPGQRWILWVNAAKKLEGYIYSSVGTTHSVTGSTTISTGTVYTAALTYDGTNLKVYLNGVVDGTASPGVTVSTAGTGKMFEIGAVSNHVTKAQTMYIDGVSFTPSALSGARLAARHAAAISTGGAPEVAASLTGAGAFTGTRVAVGVAAAALAGAGAFSAVVSGPVYSRPAPLSGAGAFTATVAQSGAVAADLTGAGAFTATVGGGVYSVAAPFAGAGVFSATVAGVTYSVGAASAGAGAFSADIFVVGSTVEVDADLSGSGSFAAETEASPGTDVMQRIGGRTRSGYGAATWAPPVVAAPASAQQVHKFDVAAAYAAPEFRANGLMAPLTSTTARTKAHRLRVLVGGRDVSFFRGITTPEPSYRLIDPLLYGSSTLDLPQVNGVFETIGTGALKWLKPEASVTYQLVDPEGAVTETVYRGIVTAVNITGSGVSLDIGGEVSGRASLRDRQVPVFKFKRDIGTLVANAMRPLAKTPFTPHYGPSTGIDVTTYGGMGELDYLSDLLSKATTNDGDTYTVGRRANGTWGMWLKDRTTVHATAYFDDARMVANLSRDISEEPNRVFATAVDDAGRRITFRVYPGLVKGDPPPYPLASNAPFGVGTVNADLDNPADAPINAMVDRLEVAGYLSRDDGLGSDYDAKVVRAVKRLQDDAGLAESGTMNPATWDALYDLGTTGYSLDHATTLPAAQRSAVRPWNRTSAGALSTRNPNYDRHKVVVDRSIAVGTGFDRQQTKDFARGELGGGSNWVGTLTCHMALISGEHNYGDPLDAADVLPGRMVKPGMNLWAPNFDGGTLFYVSGVEVPSGGDAVTLTLDTRARDTMKAWEVITRNRESRTNPARAWIRSNRSSTIDKDAIGTWDAGLGGKVDKTTLKAGWNVIPVVAGQEGTVQQVRIALRDNTEFAAALFGRKVTREWLASQVPAPLTEAGAERWDKVGVSRRMEDKIKLAHWPASADQPPGYAPGKKVGLNGPTGDPVTGEMLDDSQLSYRTFGGECVLYLAIWVPSANVLPAGRVLRNQGEEGS